VLHYGISEGANAEIIQYLTRQNPSLVKETDSFQAIPLHLAATYPPSSEAVLRQLLGVHPEGAKALDHKSMTPLHRACKSRASLEKVLALVEANPDALHQKDWERNATPLGWAEGVGRRLSDPVPEVVETLQMIEDILTLGSDNADNEGEECCIRARRIMAHFRSIQWRGGIRMVMSRNLKLVSLLNTPIGLFPELLALIGGDDNAENGCCCSRGSDDTFEERDEAPLKCRTECMFSVLVQRPDIVGADAGAA